MRRPVTTDRHSGIPDRLNARKRKGGNMEIPSTLTTRTGGTITVPPETLAHLEAHPDVGALIEEAVGLLDSSSGAFIATDVDMGREVGLSACVPAPRLELDTEATFALRVNRPRPSRVVVGAEKVPTSRVAIIAAPTGGGTYRLITAWVGPLAPKEPGDASPGAEFDQSFNFWSSHALIWEAETAASPVTSTWREVLGLK